MNPREKKPTIRDLSVETGLSVGAISQILTGKRKGRPANVEKLQAAIARLEYRSNQNARILSSGRTRTLGLVFFFDVIDLFNAKLRALVEHAGKQHGYEFIPNNLLPSDYPLGLERESLVHDAFENVFGRLIERRVEGIISSGYVIDRTAAGQLIAEGVRLSLWEPEEAMPPEISVTRADWTGVIKAILAHLTGLGHRQIHLLAGMWRFATTREEVAAFRRQMTRLGLSHEGRISHSESFSSEETGYRFIMEAFDRRSPVTALICADDRMAVGALAACYKKGIAVPGELSVVGVNDTFPAPWTCPPLTTVHIDAEDAAGKLLEGLLMAIETGAGRQTKCKYHLIERESTAPPRL